MTSLISSSSSSNMLEIAANSALSITLPPNATNSIYVDVLLSVTAVLFQVHSDRRSHSVKIGPSSGAQQGSFVSGSSVGFVQRVLSNSTRAGCVLVNPNATNSVMVELWATTLGAADPVPGGCALDFPLPQVPTLLLSFPSPSYHELRWAPACHPMSRDSDWTADCPSQTKRDQLEYKLYGMFLESGWRSLRTEDVFSSYSMFATGNETMSTGRKMCTMANGQNDKLLVASWPGRVLLLNIVVTNKTSTRSSGYVSILTTGCDQDICSDSSSWDVWIVLGVLAAASFVMAVSGHKFFRFAQFVMGFLVFCFIAFTLISRFQSSLTPFQTLISSAACGILGGLLFLGIWEGVGSPLLNVLLSTLSLGFGVAALLSYAFFDEWDLLYGNRSAHFLIFASVLLLTSLLLLYFTKFAHVVSCSGIGAFMFVSVVSVYAGGSLHYIFIRAIQRFVIPSFSTTMCFIVPFTTTDVLLSVLWVGVVLFGSAAQWHLTQEQAPFPPPPLPLLWTRMKMRAGDCRIWMARCCSKSSSPLLVEDSDPANYGAIPS